MDFFTKHVHVYMYIRSGQSRNFAKVTILPREVGIPGLAGKPGMQPEIFVYTSCIRADAHERMGELDQSHEQYKKSKP